MTADTPSNFYNFNFGAHKAPLQEAALPIAI